MEWVGWAAGVFEGEGCVTMRNRRSALLTVKMTDEDVVRKFHSVVKCGVVYGPYEREGRKPCWAWVLGNISDLPEIERLYKLFRPYLSRRRKARFQEVLAVSRVTCEWALR